VSLRRLHWAWWVVIVVFVLLVLIYLASATLISGNTEFGN